MHLELIVPALHCGRKAPRRLPALELLLARARRTFDTAMPLEHWLLAAFSAPEDPLPAGALTLAAGGGAPGDATWVRADPVHLLQQREMLVLVPPPSIRIARDEAQALSAALNAHFGPELEIHALEPECWSARVPHGEALDALPLLEAAGRNVDAMLPGSGARRWNALLNEAQMLLHAHPVNAAREARGERPVNSLWFWGLGRMPALPACRWQTVFAHDALARGLAGAGGARAVPGAESAEAWLAALPADGRHLAVLGALRTAHALDNAAAWTRELDALEGLWIAVLLAALRSDRIGMVTLHVPDGAEACSYELARADLRKFWRRPRPLVST